MTPPGGLGSGPAGVPGLQNERTSLSLTRTVLSWYATSTAVAGLLGRTHPWLGTAVGLAALVSCGAVYARLPRRYRRAGEAFENDRSVSAPTLLLALTVGTTTTGLVALLTLLFGGL